jgi:hypothetical protein
LSGRAEEALTRHRRSMELCDAGIPGQSAMVVGQYHAASRYYLGNDLAVLGRWAEAEVEFRQALAAFEAADMPAWTEPARLDLGLALLRLSRHAEARETLLVARRALAELNSPREPEVDAALRELDELTENPLPSTPAATHNARHE